MTLAVIPIRSFRGMSRLSGDLDVEARSLLMSRLAAGTVAAAHSAGTDVAIVTGDPDVGRWADEVNIAVIREPVAGGLDAAARAGIAAANGRRWLVLHADLPLLGPPDVAAVIGAAADGFALAPSHDGGTSAIAGRSGDFPFRYGPGSFQRHLAAIGGNAVVVTRLGLGADVDRPADLEWLRVLDAALR
jgi:2-phospho-L-lactate guanylyltransferase